MRALSFGGAEARLRVLSIVPVLQCAAVLGRYEGAATHDMRSIGPPSNLTQSEAEQCKESAATKISESELRLSRLENTSTDVDHY